MTTVLYPGSFDPFHLGHLDVVEQAVALFGGVVVAVMHNPEKPSGLFSTGQRVDMAVEVLAHLPSVAVRPFPGLAVDAARDAGAECIVKGLRSASDFDVEQQMAHTNRAVSGVRTVYLPCAPSTGFISSRFIREVSQNGGDASSLVPPAVARVLAATFPPRRTS